MNWAPVATVIAAGIAAIAALVSGWYAQRAARANRALAAEDIALKFREPLLQAAFNLQTRLYNIVRMSLLQSFESSERSGDREYAIENTLYLVGQYLCWVEIVRRESQFLDPRRGRVEREVADQIERVRAAFASSEQLAPELRMFRGQQRAVGEVMMEVAERPQPGSPRWDCMGYAQFTERMADDKVARWFRAVRADLDRMKEDPSVGSTRLTAIQHELLALVELLDPEALRTSGRLRERL